MGDIEFYKLEGKELDPKELSIQNCISVKQLITDEDYLFFELIKCKKDDSGSSKRLSFSSPHKLFTRGYSKKFMSIN